MKIMEERMRLDQLELGRLRMEDVKRGGNSVILPPVQAAPLIIDLGDPPHMGEELGKESSSAHDKAVERELQDTQREFVESEVAEDHNEGFKPNP